MKEIFLFYFFFFNPKLWVWNRSQGNILILVRQYWTQEMSVSVLHVGVRPVCARLSYHTLDVCGVGTISVWASEELLHASARSHVGATWSLLPVACHKTQLPIDSFMVAVSPPGLSRVSFQQFTPFLFCTTAANGQLSCLAKYNSCH